MSILALCLVPVLQMSGTSGQAVQKSQNLRSASSLAHKIAQHLLALPYEDIVDTPERPIADGPDDGIFNPFSKPGTSLATALRLTAGDLPGLSGMLRKFRFRYLLDVVGDQPKDVKIRILWDEADKTLDYSLRVYVARH